MHANDDNERIQRLEAEVRFLRRQRRESVDALEMAANLGYFETTLLEAENEHAVLMEVAERLRGLIAFKAVSFYLVDQKDSSFSRAFCDFPEYAPVLDFEVDSLIDDHSFFRILKQGKPEVLVGMSRGVHLVLHTLATLTRVRGMFVGILDKDVKEIADTHYALISIVLLAGAAALDSLETYRHLRRLHRKLEHTAEDATRQYLEIFMDVPVGAFQETPNGRYLMVNPEYARLAGYADPEEMIAQVTDISAQLYTRPAERERYKEHLRRYGRAVNFEVELKRRDGRPFWVSLNTTVKRDAEGNIVYNGFLTDITGRRQAQQEREKLQSQLLQAQKMESLGILAGGVAHDFNNLLQAMSGNIELLLQGESLDPQIKTRLQTVAQSMDRAAGLVKQLLLFSRKAESRKIRIDLNHEVEGAVRILERTIPKMIALDLHLDPSAWPLLADPVQVEQVLLNLANNAVDAMPDGGSLEIRTVNELLDESFVKKHPGAMTGRHVLLTVTDTGLGMDKEVLEHVFDPFFTTKGVGRRGAGLGLASAYGIVKSHCGYIECYSEPGRGTTFRIYWPAMGQEEIFRDPETLEIMPPGGSETILVVDDEPEIRKLTRDILEAFGYAVHCVAGGEQALQVYREHGRDIDLVLLDLNMPGMGGYRCLDILLQLDPSAKVVIASGYSAHGHAGNALSSGAKGFISKPYQLQELATTVREVLEGERQKI